MAASAGSVNINSDTPPRQNDEVEIEEPRTPAPTQSGQWQTYISDRTPISQKKIWKSK